MAIPRTSLLDLPLPVTGSLSGDWGAATNNGLTEYLDIAVAGSLVLNTDADVTLTSTDGDENGTNIGSTTAQYAILRWTATGSTTRNITVPAKSKTYIVINATGGTQSIVLRGAGPTTGVTIVSGEKAVCAWNGSDFVKVGGAAGGTNTQVQYNNNGVFGGITNATTDGTTLSMTSPKVITSINDTNGNELLKVTATASAVNELTLANAAAGNAPTLSATGDDTNIGINITPKGTGVVTISNAPVMSALTASQAVFTTAGKALTSNAITGTGNVVMSASPTLTGTIAAASLQLSSLTSGRVSYSTTSGLQTDSANLLYSGTDLTVYGLTVGRGAGAVSTNTAVGASALTANTNGSSNTAVGYQALYSNITGATNTAFGHRAGYYVTNSDNTLVGNDAGRTITTGAQNTALGSYVMNNSVGVTGSENVGIGRAVLSALTSGSYNIAIGNGALVSNTIASNNTAVGYQAGYSNQTGANNTALGYQAVYTNSTGFSLVGLGWGALKLNTTGYDNAAVGVSALGANTTGISNTALGNYSLQANTTASNNTAVGYQAGYSNTTGVATFGTVTGGSGYTNGTYNNVQLTYSSGTTATTYPTANIVVSGGAVTTVTLVSAGTGFKDTTTVLTAPAASIGGTGSGFTVPVSTLAAASNNTAVGYQAGYSNTTGGITAVGDRAAYSNTTGNTNVAVGGTDSPSGWGAALYSNTTGSRNTAVGTASLNANTTGLYNTAVGALALRLATTASSNTAIGHSALGQGTTGSNNTALGDSALISNTTASYNTAVGYQAGYSNTTSQQNTAVGYQALYSVLPATISVSAGALTNGVEYTITGLGTVNWTSIGAASATVGVKFTYNNVTITGSGGSVTQNVNANNVAIGYQAGDVITTGTGNVIIGGGADPSVNSATDQIVIGNGVTGQANTNVTIGNGTGKIYNAYTVNATWTQTSDGTMKNVIGPDSLGLSFINRLNPILFTWKAQNDLPPEHPYYAEENKRDTTRVIHGFVAQEVKAALDAEGCSTFNGWDQGDDGIQAISREMFISPLVKAVQELSAQVEQLKAELAALKGA